MPRRPAVSRAAIERSIKALEAEGLGVAGVLHRPGGEVLILTGAPQAPQLIPPADPLDAWREKRRGLRAAQGS